MKRKYIEVYDITDSQSFIFVDEIESVTAALRDNDDSSIIYHRNGRKSTASISPLEVMALIDAAQEPSEGERIATAMEKVKTTW